MSEQQDTAYARFFSKPKQNAARSQAEGRPIFDDVVMVEIRPRGDTLTVFHDEVFHRDGTPKGDSLKGRPYIERFAQAYQAFKAGQRQAQTGTPLEMWPDADMTPAKIYEFKALNIFSVEDLASVPDSALPRMGIFARKIRDKARSWLETAKGSAASSRVAELEARLADMEARMASVAAAPVADEPAEEAEAKAIEDCTDDELKTFLRRSGETVRGNPSRETLLARAHAVATREAAE